MMLFGCKHGDVLAGVGRQGGATHWLVALSNRNNLVAPVWVGSVLPGGAGPDDRLAAALVVMEKTFRVAVPASAWAGPGPSAGAW